MEKHLTLSEAWEDFYLWMQSVKDTGEIKRMPADVQEAQYAFTGDRKYGLGNKRIVNLLTKYAPDRYEFRSVVIVHEK